MPESSRVRVPERGWRYAPYGWWALTVPPLLFGAGLLLHRWWAGRTLWLDEQMIARNIRDRGFADLAGPLDFNQSAPLGWLWAQHAVVDLLGTGERSLRLVPLACGLGALAAAWCVGRRRLGPAGTFATVSLLAVNASLLRYSAEVKQYAGDVLWVLVLLGVAIWAVDPADRPGRPPRIGLWWLVAAVACLFSMGAVLATPALALVLVGAAWSRGRWRAALLAAAPALLWLAAFATQYWYTLRHVRGNETMAEFWQSRGYPPGTAGPLGVARWLVRRLEVLAGDPLGLDAAGLGRGWLLFAAAVFWALVAAGIVVAARRNLPVGLLLAGPPASGVLLAVVQISPLSVRLAMWITPALFLAVGVAVDAAVRALPALLRRRPGPGRDPGTQPASGSGPGGRLVVGSGPGARLAGGAGAAALLAATVALAPLPVAAARPLPPPGIDDRAGVTWLVRQHRPGDLTLVVRGSHHAVAWYAPGDALEPRYEVRAPNPGTECEPGALRRRVAGFERVLLYGRIRDGAAGRAAEVLTAELAGIGAVVEAADAGPVGIARIVALRPEPERPPATDACLVFS